MGIVGEALIANLQVCMKKSDEVMKKIEELQSTCEFLHLLLDPNTLSKIEEVKKILLEIRENAHDRFDKML